MPDIRPGARVCFVSCASGHRAHANFLKLRFGEVFPETIDFFIDSNSIEPSEKWHEKIVEKLREAYIVLVLLTPRTIGRPWLIFEAAAAVALNAKLVPLRFCGLPAEMVPAPLTQVQSVDLSNRHDVEGLVRQMITALPPKPQAVATCARAIARYFKRATPDIELPRSDEFLPSIESRLTALATLSPTQRRLFFHVLEWQGDTGILESSIRKGCLISYLREGPVSRSLKLSSSTLRRLPISPSEYYFRLRELLHFGLLTMVTEGRYENRWTVRPEMARTLRPRKEVRYPRKRH